MHGHDVTADHGRGAGRRPRRPGRTAVLAVVALMAGAVLAGCGNDGSSAASSPAPASASASACPASTSSAAGAGRAGGPPSGQPAGGTTNLVQATTIKKTDNSTSTVIDPAGPAITCDTSAVTTTDDITYSSPTAHGVRTDLKLDIQVPKTSGRKPLVVYVTGGGWVLADRTGNLDQRTYVADQGYVVASVQYRTTTGGATYEDALADVKSAIRYLRANAGTYGIDTGHVFVWGQSAGGYLAAMTGVTSGDRRYDVGDHLDQSSAVQGVVDEFGPADLSRLAADYDQAAKDFNYAAGNSAAQWVYGPGTTRSVAQYTDQVAAADPATHITSATPPFLLMHGTADPLVSPSQTLDLCTALRKKGVDAERVVLTGAGHGDLGVAALTGTSPSAAPSTSPSASAPGSAAQPWSTEKTMSYLTGFLSDHSS
ncbi:alpha/beta hydrolase fold domain-containing protein [Streptomyces sp. NPDC090499]|uniref:alpha/beta hydrolase fold domain-containing protein n=1 Tax=Streptomyces sp. NPDC090499 TaxID=3365965 RepID=UPI0038051B07